MTGSETSVVTAQEKNAQGKTFMGQLWRSFKVFVLNPLAVVFALVLLGSFFTPNGRTNSKKSSYADLTQNLSRSYQVVKSSFLKQEEDLTGDGFGEKKLSQNFSFAAVFVYLCATYCGAFFLQKATSVVEKTPSVVHPGPAVVANTSTNGMQENPLHMGVLTEIPHFWSENMILGPISVFLKTLAQAKDLRVLDEAHVTIAADDVTAAEPKILCAQYFLSTIFFITAIILLYYVYHWIYNIFFYLTASVFKGVTPTLYNRLLVVQNLRKVAFLVFLNGSILYFIATTITDQISQNGHLVCNYEPTALLVFYFCSAMFYILMEIYERLNPAIWSPNGPLYQALKHKKVVTVQSWCYQYWPTVYLYSWTPFKAKSTNSTITKAEQYHLLWLKKDSLNLKLKNFWVFVYALNLCLIPPFLLFAAPGLLIITLLDFSYELITRILWIIYFRRTLAWLYLFYTLGSLSTGVTLTNLSLVALKENTSLYEVLKNKLASLYELSQ